MTESKQQSGGRAVAERWQRGQAAAHSYIHKRHSCRRTEEVGGRVPRRSHPRPFPRDTSHHSAAIPQAPWLRLQINRRHGEYIAGRGVKPCPCLQCLRLSFLSMGRVRWSVLKRRETSTIPHQLMPLQPQEPRLGAETCCETRANPPVT